MKTKTTKIPTIIRIKSRVTEKDFENGEAGECLKCPVALATIRGLEQKNIKFDKVEVLIGSVDLKIGNYCYQASLSDPVSCFIGNFDRLTDKKVEKIDKYLRKKIEFTPFDFSLTFRLCDND